MLRLFAATVSLAILGTAVAAQDAPPPPSAQGEQPAPDMGPGTTPLPPPGPRHHGERHAKTGFDIRMGDDNGLKVECGDQPLAECIAAAQPLIDRIAPPRD